MIYTLKHLQQLLTTNYFQLFGLPAGYDIDLKLLHANFLNLQKQFHPDCFVNSDVQLTQLVLLLSSKINQAYTTLKSPLLRGIYLLKQANIELNLAQDTQLPQSFLLLQMEVHEQIEDAVMANDIQQLEPIKTQLTLSENNLIAELGNLFVKEDYIQASECLKQLSFYERLKTRLLSAYEQIIED
jgi:molecular chaperone HscB